MGMKTVCIQRGKATINPSHQMQGSKQPWLWSFTQRPPGHCYRDKQGVQSRPPWPPCPASLPPHHLVHCSRLLGLTAGYRGEPIKKRKKKRNSGVLETESNASLPINHDPASPLLATIPTGHLVINSVGYEWSTELGVLNWGSWKNGLSPSIPPLETKKIKQAGYKIIHIK